MSGLYLYKQTSINIICFQSTYFSFITHRTRNIELFFYAGTKGKGERIFGSVVGRVSGVVNGHAKEGVAFLLSKRVLEGVVEYKEVSARPICVKVKFGEEF